MPVRRPAFLCATGFVAGTLGGLYWGDVHHAAWPALATAILATIPLRHYPRARGWLIICAAFLLGWALATRPGDRLRAGRARLAAAADAGARITVVGEVAGIPRVKKASRGEVCHRFTIIRIELVEGDRRTALPRIPISVHWYGSASPDAPHPIPGERWRLTGRLQWARRTLRQRVNARSRSASSCSRAPAPQTPTAPATGWRAGSKPAAASPQTALPCGIGEHPDRCC